MSSLMFVARTMTKESIKTPVQGKRISGQLKLIAGYV